MSRLDPIAFLASRQREALVTADIRDPQGVLRVSRSLTLSELAAAPFFTNARLFMAALDEAPVRATKELGNLERRFVARMVDELDLDRKWIPATRHLNEGDVFDLHVLRVVLGLAGLIKKRGGLFSLTQRGRRLLAPERAAELYELLLRTYFGRFNLRYGRGFPEDPYVQQEIVLTLWLIRRLAEHPVVITALAKLAPHDVMIWREGSLFPGPFDHALSVLVLEPLERFGLVRCDRPDRYAYRKATWQIAPLFDEALSFVLDDAVNGEVSSAAAPAPRIVRLTIMLNDVEPPIWRRLEVPDDVTFERLHVYLNAAMGWLDYHLHDFQVGPRRITPNIDWLDEAPREDETMVTLASVLGASRVRRFTYRYDFGDGWEHTVAVEIVGPPRAGVFYPRCLTAERACPPEDCGGVHGYLDLLRALADPTDPEREDLLGWLGEPFDPEAVDIEEINRVLRVSATGELRPEDWEHLDDH